LIEVEKIITLNKTIAEWAEPIGSDYLNVLFVLNNDFAISLIIMHKLISNEILKKWGYTEMD
jgi:hypothetical protein